MSKPVAPSRIARTLAGQLWPDVQFQNKIAKGTYGFSCAGHGGILAVVGVADLDESRLEAARAEGKTEFVGDYYGKLLTSERYTADTFERMRERGMPVWEVLVGEEDCDWAVVLYCQADPQEALIGARGKYLAEHVDLADVESAIMDYNPDFYTRCTGVAVPAAMSSVVREREFRAEHEATWIGVSAVGDWHKKVPAGMVGVTATLGGNRDSESWSHQRHFLVPQAEYDNRTQHGFIVNPTEHPTWIDHA